MRQHRSDMILLITMLILMGVGLLIMYTIGPVRAIFLNAEGANYSESYFFRNQLIAIVAGIVMFFACYKIGYEKLRKFSGLMLLFSFGLCLVLLIAAVAHMPIAVCTNGACRWLNIGFSLQPAELVKFSLVLYLASLLAEYRKNGLEHNIAFWLKYSLSIGISLGFIMLAQKDLGSALPIIVMALFMLFAAGIKVRRFIMVVAIILVGGVLAIVSSPHRMERIATYFNSANTEEVDDSDTYHIKNALIAIGSGGFFGVGIGNSVQATGYLPESINDSVFAIMGETMGFVGVILVLFVFAILIYRILHTAETLIDTEEYLVCVGAFSWIFTHVVVNIMAMTGLVPLTGITLPLLSYGGTSMMMTAAMLGIVFQLSSHTTREIIPEEVRKGEIVSSKTEKIHKTNYSDYTDYRRRNR